MNMGHTCVVEFKFKFRRKFRVPWTKKVLILEQINVKIVEYYIKVQSIIFFGPFHG